MKRLFHTCTVIALITGSFQLHAFDGFMAGMHERYDSFMLGSALYKALPQKKDTKQCDLLKKNKQVLSYTAETNYVAPWWINMFNHISPDESLFSYAQRVYQVIVNVLDIVEKQIKKDFPTIKTDSLELQEDMNFILIAIDARDYPNSALLDTQIKRNTEVAKNILENYFNTVKNIVVQPNTTPLSPPKSVFGQTDRTFAELVGEYKKRSEELKDVVTEKQKALLDRILKGLQNIDNAQKTRFTRIERWHRNEQIKRFSNYVSKYCSNE